MQSQTNEFRPLAKERLFLAVVNQAVSDVLENGKDAREAERWLLSRDFDALDRIHVHLANASESLLQKRIRESLSPDSRAPRRKACGLADCSQCTLALTGLAKFGLVGYTQSLTYDRYHAAAVYAASRISSNQK